MERRDDRAEPNGKASFGFLTFSFLGREIVWNERVDSGEKRRKRKEARELGSLGI